MMQAPGLILSGAASIAGQPLFDPLTIEIASGRWTCLLGPSGVGKTTVLRFLAGLETGAIFTGTITASDGEPVPARVSYMAQTDLLLPWLDVRGNVTLGARLRGQTPDTDRAEALIVRLGLDPHRSKRPAQLSGGQRQRVALARTLMEERPIVLLDEPFSALDARLRAEMQELFAAELSGATVLLVTHDPAEAARLGDTIYILEEAGLRLVPPPPGPAIRPVDAPETLQAQAHLLGLLRAAS
ncbi:MAG: putative hydroxymethylpyrimidine transport system ATP-binding protein [Paracoccaceae bacterium]|jgi:putative hydroxymethylpyrimidine transport system ATP-binding protein